MKTATEIVDRTLTLLDEQLSSFTALASTEMSVREMVLEVLPTVARMLIKQLPYELKRYLAKSGTLSEESLSYGEAQTYTKQKVAFTAPSDFWELVSIKLRVWAKPVTEYILIDSPEYDVLHNPFTRPGKYNPKVALSNKASGSDARIECFSVGLGDSKIASEFQYISFNNVPDDAGNSWPDELFEHITKALAAEINVIKNRVNEALVKSDEISNAIEQHQ